MTTTFSALMKGALAEAGALAVEVPADWAQGRTIYGGLQLALAVRAMRGLVPSLPLRTLQATFIAPLSQRVEARSQVLRVGKNATHVEARLLDGESTAALVVGVFGQGRDSSVKLLPTQSALPPQVPLPLGFVPGITPNFLQHFEGRQLLGSYPFSGLQITECAYEVSIKDEGPFSEGHLIAFADFVPPVALVRMARPVPGSTLTWMLEFLANPSELEALPLGKYRVDATLFAARDGYTSQSVMVWGPSGEPLAVSRQSMLVSG